MTNVEKINKILPNNHRYISPAMAEKMLNCEYNAQAINFLLETETTCEIEFTGLSKPSWGKTRVNSYRVTLKNKKHEYTFDFYDSIKNTEDNKKATYNFYSVIACMDLNYSSNFDDFCSEFGYTFNNEREYIKAKQTYFAIVEQDENLRKLFSEEQLEKLQEIR